MDNMRTLVLASTSPRRKIIFAQLGIPFVAASPKYDEDNTLPVSLDELVQRLATGKARSLAENYSDAIIIGSDTLVELRGKILPKPNSIEDAVEMLLSLSGTFHSIITGYALFDTKSGKLDTGVQKTIITFRKIEPQEAWEYVRREDVLGVAGAYDHEHLGAVFVENLNGDFYSSIGFPLYKIAASLKDNFGLNFLESH